MEADPAAVLSSDIAVRDELIARIAHDVRTPIGAVLTWLELLKAHANDPQARRAVEAAQQSARDLVDIVSVVEDAQRLVKGTLELQLAPVDLRGLLDAAADRARRTAEARAVVLERELGPPAGVVVRGDGARLRQVFAQLAFHCVSLSGPGTVRFELRKGPGVARVSLACPALTLSVALQQALVAEGEWPSIAGPNGRAVLDLAVATRLLRLHGGRLEAEPGDGGVGTHLSATLPLA